LAAKRREGAEFGQQFFLVDLVKALGDVRIQHIFGFQENPVVNGFDCIMAPASRAEPVGV
jgi:hypothetical protein